MRSFISLFAGLGLVFFVVAIPYAKRFALPAPAVAGIYLCFLCLIALILAPAVAGAREALRRRFALLPIFLFLPYFLYAAGTGDFRWLALGRLVGIAAPVLLLYSLPKRHAERFVWQDAPVALWLVFVVLSRFTHGIWKVPANLDFMARLFLAAVAVVAWMYVRPIPGLGYTVSVNKTALLAAGRNLVYFALVAIPLGFALRFTAWNPRWEGAGPFLASFLEILLFVALLEELFFRGFLQNLLERTLASRFLGHLVASVLFGLFHILHAPFPNWRYVILASIAGWFYGSAWRQGGTLLSSVLTHAAVDTLWRTFFTRPIH